MSVYIKTNNTEPPIMWIMSNPLTYKWNTNNKKWEEKGLVPGINVPTDSFLNWNEILYYIPPIIVSNRKIEGRWSKISDRVEIFTLAETPGDDSGLWQEINKPQRPADIQKSNRQQMSEEDNKTAIEEQARQEQARQEQARQEQARQEQARQEQARQEQARQEQERMSMSSEENNSRESYINPPQLTIPCETKDKEKETSNPYLDAIKRNGTVYVVPRKETYEKIIPEMQMDKRNIAEMICAIVNQHKTTKNQSSITVQHVDAPGIIVNNDTFGCTKKLFSDISTEKQSDNNLRVTAVKHYFPIEDIFYHRDKKNINIKSRIIPLSNDNSSAIIRQKAKINIETGGIIFHLETETTFADSIETHKHVYTSKYKIKNMFTDEAEIVLDPYTNEETQSITPIKRKKIILKELGKGGAVNIYMYLNSKLPSINHVKWENDFTVVTEKFNQIKTKIDAILRKTTRTADEEKEYNQYNYVTENLKDRESWQKYRNQLRDWWKNYSKYFQPDTEDFTKFNYKCEISDVGKEHTSKYILNLLMRTRQYDDRIKTKEEINYVTDRSLQQEATRNFNKDKQKLADEKKILEISLEKQKTITEQINTYKDAIGEIEKNTSTPSIEEKKKKINKNLQKLDSRLGCIISKISNTEKNIAELTSQVAISIDQRMQRETTITQIDGNYCLYSPYLINDILSRFSVYSKEYSLIDVLGVSEANIFMFSSFINGFKSVVFTIASLYNYLETVRLVAESVTYKKEKNLMVPSWESISSSYNPEPVEYATFYNNNKDSLSKSMRFDIGEITFKSSIYGVIYKNLSWFNVEESDQLTPNIEHYVKFRPYFKPCKRRPTCKGLEIIENNQAKYSELTLLDVNEPLISAFDQDLENIDMDKAYAESLNSDDKLRRIYQKFLKEKYHIIEKNQELSNFNIEINTDDISEFPEILSVQVPEQEKKITKKQQKQQITDLFKVFSWQKNVKEDRKKSEDDIEEIDKYEEYEEYEESGFTFGNSTIKSNETAILKVDNNGIVYMNSDIRVDTSNKQWKNIKYTHPFNHNTKITVTISKKNTISGEKTDKQKIKGNVCLIPEENNSGKYYNDKFQLCDDSGRKIIFSSEDTNIYDYKNYDIVIISQNKNSTDNTNQLFLEGEQYKKENTQRTKEGRSNMSQLQHERRNQYERAKREIAQLGMDEEQYKREIIQAQMDEIIRKTTENIRIENNTLTEANETFIKTIVENIIKVFNIFYKLLDFEKEFVVCVKHIYESRNLSDDTITNVLKYLTEILEINIRSDKISQLEKKEKEKEEKESEEKESESDNQRSTASKHTQKKKEKESERNKTSIQKVDKNIENKKNNLIKYYINIINTKLIERNKNKSIQIETVKTIEDNAHKQYIKQKNDDLKTICLKSTEETESKKSQISSLDEKLTSIYQIIDLIKLSQKINIIKEEIDKLTTNNQIPSSEVEGLEDKRTELVELQNEFSDKLEMYEVDDPRFQDSNKITVKDIKDLENELIVTENKIARLNESLPKNDVSNQPLVTGREIGRKKDSKKNSKDNKGNKKSKPWKQKYIKYKKKYLDLKNKLNL